MPSLPPPNGYVCVFCGSNIGFDPAYRTAAVEFTRAVAAAGHGIVYGGGSVGLMGAIADEALTIGAPIIGVIPDFLATRELLHTGVTDMRIVPSMHARKALMAELSSAFVALPGGLGTFEELFEVLTWTQLGLYRHPIGLLDTEGYFEPLLRIVDHAVVTGFCRPEHRDLFVSHREPASLLTLMTQWRPPQAAKWMADESET